MTSQIYTEIGIFINTDDTFQGKPYFQKNINPLDITHQVELQVAQKIHMNPQANLVTVYEISYQPSLHIKYELLDCEKDLPSWSELEPQIITALRGLHQMKCIYIDMKDDNMGYSVIDNCWKLFDFDSSGICTSDLQKWIVKPPTYFQMRDITSLENNVSDFLDRVKYSKKDSVISDLEKIKNKKELTRYDIISVFLCFGKIISLD